MKGNLIRIGDLFEIEKGSLQSSKNVEGKFDFITAAETWKTHESYTHNCEALVFAAAASGSLGRTHYVNGKFIASDLCFILVPKDLKKHYVDLKFYHFVFNNIRDQIVKATKTGTSKDAINITNFSNYEIPYIKEQSQKIWIEKLKKVEAIKVDLLELNEFQQTHLRQLRQAILQEAVQGKLTKQDPKDEPAEKLLQRIKTEKHQLIAAGKLKKEKELPPITEDEVPFELPKGWVWCRFDEIKANKLNAFKAGPFGSALKKQDYSRSGYKIYGQEQVIANDPSIGDYYIDQDKFDQLKSCEVVSGDILISLVGTIGKVLVLPLGIKPGIINPRLVKLSLSNEINRDYIKLMLQSPLIKNHLADISHGGTMNILNLRLLRTLKFPLPPIYEQQRIVIKVEQLMQMVNELEQQVQQSQAQAGQLLQAVLKEAFTNKTKEYKMNDAVTMAAE